MDLLKNYRSDSITEKFPKEKKRAKSPQFTHDRISKSEWNGYASTIEPFETKEKFESKYGYDGFIDFEKKLNEATSSVHNKGADTGISIKERMAIAR